MERRIDCSKWDCSAGDDEGRINRKRLREQVVVGTPRLVESHSSLMRSNDDDHSHDDDDETRRTKKSKGNHDGSDNPSISIPTKITTVRNESSDLLRIVPEDVMSHVLSFVGSAEDRFALQCTCKFFKAVSDTDHMMVNVDIGGNEHQGMAIIQDDDSPNAALEALAPFAKAGNLQAIYFMGIINSFCGDFVKNGVILLKLAAQRGYVRAHYSLGLILRDYSQTEAMAHMKLAALKGYLPALQELMPARLMKTKYGDTSAEELQQYLDPPCLSRLLRRHYLESETLRERHTSHCWNRQCGRWAYRTHGGGTPQQQATVSTPTTATTTTAVAAVPTEPTDLQVSRMKMCSRCCRAKYCSKLCQVYSWRSGAHKNECPYLYL